LEPMLLCRWLFSSGKNPMQRVLSLCLRKATNCSCTNGITLLGRAIWGRAGVRATSVAVEVQQKMQSAPRRTSAVDIVSLRSRLDPARALESKYTMLGVLGEGAFGCVFRAQAKVTGDLRAIKKIGKTRVTANNKLLRGELEAMMHMDHPNIARLFEFYEDARAVYLVTEFCSGGDFGDLHYGQDDYQEITILFQDIVMALAYCHNNGVAHRDIKFENCLIQKSSHERRVGKVIDFGLAAMQPTGDQASAWLSEQLGTQFFLAPEVVDKSIKYGVKCDCWSLGVMLYSIFTDQHPCTARGHAIGNAQLLKKILHSSVRTGPLEEANVPQDAVDFVLKLLEKDADSRISARDALHHEWFKTSLYHNFSRPKLSSLRSWSSCSTEDEILEVSREPSSQCNCSWLERMQEFRGYNNFEKAVLAVAAHNMETQEMEELRECFMSLDTDGNGSLSKEAIAAGIDSVGVSIPEADLTELFETINVDGSGKIHYTEWLAATVTPTLLASEKTIQHVYDFFDIEQTGVISLKGLLHLLGDGNMDTAVMEALDIEGNGKLCKEVFTALMQRMAQKDNTCGGKGLEPLSIVSDRLTGS